MNSLTNQEYLELCQKLVDQQYDDAVDNYDAFKMEWISAEPEAKEKIINYNDRCIFDLTTVHSSKIKEQLLLNNNFRVGKFKIRIFRYQQRHQILPKKGLTVSNILNDKIFNAIEIWEERNRTPNGIPCKIDYPMIFDEDDRFTGCEWVGYFGDGNEGRSIPINTVVEIVRWLRCVMKLSAFL
jgi:hypothetical protein